MRWLVSIFGLALGTVAATAQQMNPPADDPVRTLVARLNLERYKTTIKELTQFGDRLEGTDRNRGAVDWIEAQLKSYGCPTERHRYVKESPKPPAPQPQASAPPSPVIAIGEVRLGQGGSRLRGSLGRRLRTTIQIGSPTLRCAFSMPSRVCPETASRSTVREWVLLVPTRCTSWAHTWMGEASAKVPTTMHPAPRS